jgi:hypothetical protein
MSGLNFLSADKFINRMFRKADNVVWDLMTGKIGVRTADGITTLEGAGDDAQVTTNMFDQFGVSIPAFAQSTPLAAVNVGDMILQANDKPAWVTKRNEKPTTVKDPSGVDVPGVPLITFGLMRSDGTTTTWRPPKVQMLGFESGVMVLRSLMTMLPGGASGLGQMQGMLLPMMMSGMMGGDSEDGDGSGMNLEKMIPMMLMMQMGTGSMLGADPNAAAGSMGSMMQMMMMMNMMKGPSTSNKPKTPFGRS